VIRIREWNVSGLVIRAQTNVSYPRMVVLTAGGPIELAHQHFGRFRAELNLALDEAQKFAAGIEEPRSISSIG